MMKLLLGSGALCTVALAACQAPAPPAREPAPSQVAAPKKPECDVDSPAHASATTSSRTEEERRSLYVVVGALRERALEEARKSFPAPEAPGIAGPGHVEKELAVERARTREAESLMRHYFGELVFERRIDCGELASIVREGDSNGWPSR